MKFHIILSLLLFNLSLTKYDRNKGVEYAYKHYKKINHKCGSGRNKCTPYGYYGNSFCNYPHGGGDCANFVSQCLIEGGHEKLKGSPCKSFSCGVQLGSRNLSKCLTQKFKWKRECGKKCLLLHIFKKEMLLFIIKLIVMTVKLMLCLLLLEGKMLWLLVIHLK